VLHRIHQTLDTPEGTRPREDFPRLCMLDCLRTVLVVDWVEKLNFSPRDLQSSRLGGDKVLGAFLVLVVATKFFKK
jgi:hypothetical protein